MFSEMRRKDRQMPESDAIRLLDCLNYGILSTVDEDNAPYAVPISFVYTNKVIYIHSSLEGHKLNNMAQNKKVCFTIVDHNSVELKPSAFTTRYKSVVVFGVASIVDDTEEKQKALELILKKYSPEFYDSGLKYIKAAFDKTTVIKIEITKISGKQNIK